MKKKEGFKKDVKVNQLGFNQLYDQVTQLKRGLLNTVDALECILKRYNKLKRESLKNN